MRWLCLLLLIGCGGTDEVVPPDGPRPPDALVPDAGIVPDGPFVPPDAPDDSFQPDLVIVAEEMQTPPLLQTLTFNPNDAAVVEGCVGASGSRRLLRFDTVSGNLGNLDLYMGVPSADNPNFAFSPAHGHYHVPGFAEYRLVDGAGTVVTGHKQAFCLMDSVQVHPDATAAKYSCDNQGITAGWADVYGRFLDCQWVDVTGVANGTYTLEIEINPEGLLPDSNPDNNLYTLEVQI